LVIPNCAHWAVFAVSGGYIKRKYPLSAQTCQQSTHVAFFNYSDLSADHPEKMKRQPFIADNPNGPLELCTCADCGAGAIHT